MNQRTSRVDIDIALQNPKAVFAEPRDVADSPQLSRDQKLAVLRRWEEDAMRLSESESEGMVGGEENMLGRVEAAIRKLRDIPN
jgi:hypothetical protein